MKKSIALVALAFGVTSAFAQDLTSKKGEPILPEAGDWAIGIDATPFLNYAGNFFGKTANNTAPTWDFLTGNNTITVKKFKDAQTAYRATVRLGFTNTTDSRQIVQPSTSAVNYPDMPSMVTDKHHMGSTRVGLGVGIEKRRGKTRLQGYYGADVGFMITSDKDKYTYGNSLNPTGTPAITVANSTNFGSNITTDTYGNAARQTEVKSGLGFNFGVRGFIGAEYFIFSKISLGAEFGWGIGFGMQGKSKTTVESIGTNASTGTTSVGTQTTDGAKSSTFFFDTDRNNAMWGAAGKLKLNFHF
jgi:hypothetical protein